MADGQTFVGSRIAAEKRSFTATGDMNNLDIRQKFHLNRQTTELSINNTYSGLLGGFTPGVRWEWPLPGGGYAEQTAFAVAESTDDFPFDVASIQPIWIRYLNVSAKGELRYAQYVNTFEQYPCKGLASCSLFTRRPHAQPAPVPRWHREVRPSNVLYGWHRGVRP